MTYREKEFLKDKILVFLQFRRTTTEISIHLNQDPVVINYLLEQLHDEWLVNKLDLIHPPPNPKFNRCEYQTVITNKGQFFLNIEGGHKKRHNKYCWNKVYNSSKLIAVVVNTLFVSCLGYLSYKAQDKINVQENNLTTTLKDLDSLKLNYQKLTSENEVLKDRLKVNQKDTSLAEKVVSKKPKKERKRDF